MIKIQGKKGSKYEMMIFDALKTKAKKKEGEKSGDIKYIDSNQGGVLSALSRDNSRN